MALKGTLKDFGIADILQLIGQQQKTGSLMLKNKGEEVQVAFREGNIVRAEVISRNKKDLIGTMLVRAGLINEGQLDFALDTQKRTLQRLGDVLVSQNVISADTFRDMVQLQTSETLFRLFGWKSGNYAFEQQDVEVDPTLSPLRAETVLMEGFRRVDEWPVVKRRITSYGLTFDKARELPAMSSTASGSFDAALDGAFELDDKKHVEKGDFQSVGEIERKVYGLVVPGRDVQTIIDLSMLGEFETAKALCNLLNLDYLRVAAGAEKAAKPSVDGEARSGALARVGRVLVTMVVVGALLFVVSRVNFGALRFGGGNASTFTDPAAQRFASRAQISRLQAALELFRVEKGKLPESLEELANEGLVTAEDLKYPWHDEYFYRRDNAAYVLLPPLR